MMKMMGKDMAPGDHKMDKKDKMDKMDTVMKK
jgi:hypothetical protein